MNDAFNVTIPEGSELNVIKFFPEFGKLKSFILLMVRFTEGREAITVCE